MFDHPNIIILSGDKLIAEKEDDWETAICDAEYHNIRMDDDTIEIECKDRQRDTLNAVVNGEEKEIHIDLITNIFRFADEVRFVTDASSDDTYIWEKEP